MHTPPPATTLPPRPATVKVEITLAEVDQLDRAKLELDRAKLMVDLARTVQNGRHRGMLLDAAREALRPAAADLGRTLRALHLRLLEAREPASSRPQPKKAKVRR